MKRYLPFLLSLLMLVGCAENTEAPSSVPTSAAQHTTSTSTTTTATTTELADTSEPPSDVEQASPYVDDIAMLTEEGIARMTEVVRENLAADSNNYLGLFDFDRDTIPEVYLVRHTGNQGLMPVDVFSLSGDKLGSFEGYCRDGFCRLSYDDNGGVYVHNSFEHSYHQSFESLDRLVFAEDGTFIVENVVTEYGYNVDPAKFPLLEYNYYSGDTKITMEEYFSTYNGSMWNTRSDLREYSEFEIRNREANELSICSPDFGLYDIEEALIKIPQIYNEYIAALELAVSKLGCTPAVFSFDDFDDDGSCEAFILDYPSGSWYNYSSNAIFHGVDDSLGCVDCARWGEYFIAQPMGNGSPCQIFGLKDGSPYVHELSGYGMMIRSEPDLGFYRIDSKNGIFVLRKSLFDDYSHTWKPYLFHITENGFEEIVGIPVTRDDFADRPDVQAAFDEITNSGGTVTGAYKRGGYLNINYTITDFVPSPVARYRYNTYYVHLDSVTLLEEGRGIYSASITDN